MENADEKKTADSMRKRQITLADGRYLIFYDFAGLPVAAAKEIEKPASRPQPEATEEKNV